MARLHSFLLASLFISQSYLLLVKGDEALIEKTCQTTPNFDLCLRTLISNQNAKQLIQCLELYSNSKDGSKDYDGAGISVRAAMDYLGTSRDEFRKNPKISYPTGLAVRENAIAQLSSVAMVIINGLFPSSL
ncbi:hypothetical protein AAC387_Pa11g1930 [Persea americana]